MVVRELVALVQRDGRLLNPSGEVVSSILSALKSLSKFSRKMHLLKRLIDMLYSLKLFDISYNMKTILELNHCIHRIKHDVSACVLLYLVWKISIIMLKIMTMNMLLAMMVQLLVIRMLFLVVVVVDVSDLSPSLR